MLGNLEEYLPLVEAAAASLCRNAPVGVEYGDCLSWGWIGLHRAAEKWDPGRGPFPPYASTCIANAIRDGLRLEGRRARDSRERARLVRELSGR